MVRAATAAVKSNGSSCCWNERWLLGFWGQIPGEYGLKLTGWGPKSDYQAKALRDDSA